jgi:hypothetical protein
VHFLIADTTGKSVICEIDPAFFQWHFTDNAQGPQVMTNHAQHKYPDSAKFPVEKDPYSTFTRYKKLEEFIKKQTGKFPLETIKDGMQLVLGHGMKGAKEIRHRTFWTDVYDLTDRTVEVVFYLKDGTLDPKTGEYALVFSKPFSFRLEV